MTEQSELAGRDENYREYRNEHIVVTWEPSLCFHAAVCIHKLPAVFNARSRPWVNLDAGQPDEIARVVAACPSGAIKYELLDEQ